jgi:hypothetical protein
MRIKDLKLAVSICPDKDNRNYLTGVYVTRTEVVSSDGHRLVKLVEHYPLDEFLMNEAMQTPSFIVPKAALMALFAKVGKGFEECPVEIGKGFYDGQYTLLCNGQTEFFHPIEARYADFNKVESLLDGNIGEEPLIQFEWSYIADAYKALSKWEGIKSTEVLPCHFHTTGRLSGCGWFKHRNATYIIMSRRL